MERENKDSNRKKEQRKKGATHVVYLRLFRLQPRGVVDPSARSLAVHVHWDRSQAETEIDGHDAQKDPQNAFRGWLGQRYEDRNGEAEVKCNAPTLSSQGTAKYVPDAIHN
jgi:hypothetical protein